MSSFNIMSAIKVNAAALADTAYLEESLPYISTLENLFCTLKHTLQSEKAEKAASDAGTSKAADGNNSITEYDKSKFLSSCEVGTRVITADGHHGEIKNEIYGGVLVELDIGEMKRYEMWDLREEPSAYVEDKP